MKGALGMKKMIAPIIITVLVVIYLIFYFGFIISIIENMFFKVLLAVLPIAMATLMIYVCVQRIKEIRSGEEDDISKY